MQVQTINSHNNQLSFGRIYLQKNALWNPDQKTIASAIKKSMKEPLQKFNGQTAEKFYKSQGLDFKIAPHTDNTVSLTAYKGLKSTGIGSKRKYTYSEIIRIGEYDKKSKFKISDIESKTKEKYTSYFELAVIFTIITFVISAFAFQKPLSKFAERLQSKTELIDSTTNKAKTVLPDTTGVKTKVLKTIKK